MPQYAVNTEVSAGRSRTEIESILQRYGADEFMYGWNNGQALIGFRFQNRTVKITISLPHREDPAFTLTPSGRRQRSDTQALSEWEKACRQRWRALKLVIHAKLEAVDAGITTFAEEFLAWTVLPNGKTVSEYALPQIEKAIESHTMQPMLPFDGAPRAKTSV